MRTTLTLDPDVAAALERRRRERGTGLKQEVNDLLRAGLVAADQPPDDDWELPVHNSGKQLMDWREMKQILDDEDLERQLRLVRGSR